MMAIGGWFDELLLSTENNNLTLRAPEPGPILGRLIGNWRAEWHVRYGRRPKGRAASAGVRWRKTGLGHVLRPLAIGLAFCALGLWAGLVYRNNQAAFRAHAVPARAVIDQIYSGALRMSDPGAPESFDQYGIVHFQARGQTAHARVLLVDGCTGVCIPMYRVGQVLTVYYSPGNLSYARLSPPARRTSSDVIYAVWIFGFLGALFLVAAVVNMVTALRDTRLATMPRKSGRTPGSAGSGR
jgi:hypothetical protein